ncbi:MAG: hypothetical protein AB7E42_07670 [Anaerotignaceae bacterium]
MGNPHRFMADFPHKYTDSGGRLVCRQQLIARERLVALNQCCPG